MEKLKDYYPTPKELAEKMIQLVNFTAAKSILEPSAGMGLLADIIQQRISSRKTMYKRSPILETIEVAPDLQQILKSKGHKVIHDDFLSFEPIKLYDIIIMNPPFSQGDRHLTKALSLIEESGGQVICILNAETIRNPYSAPRKMLVTKLEKLNADITFIQDAFMNAERKTKVEIALINISIQKKQKKSVLIKHYHQSQEYAHKKRTRQDIISNDYIKQMIARYKQEITTGIKIIEEYHALCEVALKTETTKGIELKVIVDTNNRTDSEVEQIEDFTKLTRLKYWKQLLATPAFTQLLTNELRQSYYERLHDLQDYDFSIFNIAQMREDISRELASSIEHTIIKLFDELSHKYSTENPRNIHYFNGWRTNKAYKINKRVILTLDAFNRYRHAGKEIARPYYIYRVQNKLQDIEKALNYLGTLQATEHKSLTDILSQAQESRQTQKIQLKHFDVTFYKKGTCHIEFTNLELLKKFNIFGSQRKGWLPPSYGRTSYSKMSTEERAVVQAFEGEVEYKKTLHQKAYYIEESIKLLG